MEMILLDPIVVGDGQEASNLETEYIGIAVLPIIWMVKDAGTAYA